jgi:predicted RNA methylase
MNYDELYGVPLDEYYKILNERIDFCKGAEEVVPAKVRAEIDILQKNYDRYASRNHQLTDKELELVLNIRKLINKKKKHYERLMKWRKRRA